MNKRRILLIIIILAATFCFSSPSWAKIQIKNFHVTHKTQKTITLKWKKHVKAQKYQIKVIKISNNKLIKKIYTTKNFKKIKKLKPNTSYRFIIRVKTKNDYNKYYSVIKAKTKKKIIIVNDNNNEELEETPDPSPDPILDPTPEPEPDPIIEPDPDPILDSDPAPEPDPIEEPDPEPTPEPEPEPDPVPDEISNPILFGFWGLNGYDDTEGYSYVQDNFNASVYEVYSSGPNYNVNTLLPAVADTNMKISLNITGNYSDFDDAEGSFNLSLWETALNNYFANPDTITAMQEYIDNDTITGIMLLDDIYNFSGNDPTAEELEQMACDMRDYINVTTWIREDINDNLILENPSFKFSCLDAVGLQYSATKGDVNDYIDEQQQAADDLNLNIIAGLNIADGGNGDSGQQGYRGPGFYAMSPEEITNYGEAMLNMNNVIMFLMWEYDGLEHWPDETIGANYFNQIEYQETIYNLGETAKNYNL
ncbi:MAG: hypothetical protein V1898_04535 [Patescibacteria group bacterium]